jgi:hypothetical protein
MEVPNESGREGTFRPETADSPTENPMSDATLGPLAAAARFVFGADNATAKALTEAAAGGTEADVKRAQALVKKLPAKDRTRLMAAFQTFSGVG